jgi:hypothetical protein
MAFALSLRGVCAARASATTEPGADGTRAERNSIWSIIVPADGTCAATGDITETSVRPRFMGSPQTSYSLPLCTQMGGEI